MCSNLRNVSSPRASHKAVASRTSHSSFLHTNGSLAISAASFINHAVIFVGMLAFPQTIRRPLLIISRLTPPLLADFGYGLSSTEAGNDECTVRDSRGQAPDLQFWRSVARHLSASSP
jgi:hypothetical protein